LNDESREGFRSVSPLPAPGALSRARALLLELAPPGLAIPFHDWASLATIWDTPWLSALRRPSTATARVARRRLRLLASAPTAFAAFAALRTGDGPVHLRGTCTALPGHDADGMLWRVEVRDDDAAGPTLIEEASDFLLSGADGTAVYVVASGGHLVSTAPLRPGDTVSVFGFADQVPDRTGLVASPDGRGGLLPAIRSGTELPLLLTDARGIANKVVR
jgi:hypothetical protein